ncbi:diguanylate phosphodiesterase, partial [Xanthomonas arboricola]
MPTLPVCNACRDGQDFPTAITMAFQPIVDVSTRSIYAGEALVRGVNGESAGS